MRVFVLLAFLPITTTLSETKPIQGTISVILGTIYHSWSKHHSQMTSWRIWGVTSTHVMTSRAQLINAGSVVNSKCLAMMLLQWCSCDGAMMLLQWCSCFCNNHYAVLFYVWQSCTYEHISWVLPSTKNHIQISNQNIIFVPIPSTPFGWPFLPSLLPSDLGDVDRTWRCWYVEWWWWMMMIKTRFRFLLEGLAGFPLYQCQPDTSFRRI